MKSKFSRIFVLGLALMLAIVLALPMAVQAKTLDWGTEDLPTVQREFATGKTVQPFTDILCLSAANDGKTIWAVVQAEADHLTEEGAQEVWRSTNAGSTWSSKSPTTSNSSRVAFVAVSPDDPSTVVAAGLSTVGGDNTVWISTDKGDTWSASNVSSIVEGNITCLDVSQEKDDVRWVAVGSDGGTGAADGDLAVSEATAFATFSDATLDAWGEDWVDADVVAVKFSPQFDYDGIILVVTTNSSDTQLQMADVTVAAGGARWNAKSGYPAEIADETVADAASIALPDTYYGPDEAERVAYIGIDDANGDNPGVHRMDDTTPTKIKSGNLPHVAYNTDENQLLAGYASSGRVDMSANPDAGSPTFTRSASMKSPSGEGVSGVAWVDSTMMCSTKDVSDGTAAPLNAVTTDDESAISISTDARSWSQISLIDTDLDNITDMAVSADGSKIYAASQNSENTSYSVWRYAGGWERVLCDEFASGQDGVIIRLAPEKPEVVFVALVDTKEIRRSTDSGETWKQSRADLGTKVIADMAVKDDKIVFTVSSGGYVSTSKDGGRTFADYVKTSVGVNQIIVAPNGDILVVGEDALPPYKIMAKCSTDDGATWSATAEDTGITRGDNPVLVAADTDYATNNLIYVAHDDGDEAYVMRWEIGGDYEVWQDISAPSSYPLDSGDVISGLVAGEGMLYVAYYNLSDNASGFTSTNCPTVKRTSVTWGGGPGTDTAQGTATSGVTFGLTPQALKVSSGSIKLWAIDSTEEDDGDRLYSYKDILGKVEAPTITGPAEGYKGTIDPSAEKINPVRFTWDEVHPDVKYQFRIAPNEAISKNYITYYTGGSEFITLTDGSPALVAGIAQTSEFPFAAGDTYWWKVRVSVPTVSLWSDKRSFTIIEAKVPVAEAPVVTVTPPAVTVAPPAVTVQPPAVTVQPAPPAPAAAPAIPAYLLWTIIGIGAVLVIALIILIVRTRRVV